MDTTDILLAVFGFFGVVFGVALTFIGSLILQRLKAVEQRAAEDRKAAEDRAKEDRARAAEDRAANKADHDKLFQLVAGLQADVKVLRDRSDRADRADRSDSAG